jgi:hypothetical protein
LRNWKHLPFNSKKAVKIVDDSQPQTHQNSPKNLIQKKPKSPKNLINKFTSHPVK